jgi:polyisoprenoid-binding protein YceI
MSRYVPAVAIVLGLLFGDWTTAANAQAPGHEWQIDRTRSSVHFSVTKLGFSDVAGRFTDFTAAVTYDPAQPERSTVSWDVPVASVQTDSAKRDRSILGAEYFDAARHPSMAFRSRQVRRLDDGRLEVAGVITIKGHSEPLTIIASAVDGGFETRFEVDRFRFDVRGGRVMSRLIGRMVRVHLVIKRTLTTSGASLSRSPAR